MCIRDRDWTFAWSVLLHASEPCIFGEQEKKRRVVGFEFWCYRRMLKISWLDRVTNEEVLKRMEEPEPCLILQERYKKDETPS